MCECLVHSQWKRLGRTRRCGRIGGVCHWGQALRLQKDVKFSATAPEPCLFALNHDDNRQPHKLRAIPQSNALFCKSFLGHGVCLSAVMEKTRTIIKSVLEFTVA